MSHIRLTGQLICENSDQAALVAEHLPRHIELTRAESGCIYFEVNRSDDLLVWNVDELYLDQSAFAAHQERVASSTWGQVTQEIRRDYVVFPAVSDDAP